MINPSNGGFIFDLACAFIFIAAVPLILLFLFSPLMIKSLQKIQEQRNGQVKISRSPNKIKAYFRKHLSMRTTCPRCGAKNDVDKDYCTQCGTRLRI